MRGRVGREIQHQHLGLGPGIAYGAVQFFEEVDPVSHRHMADIRTGNHKTVGMDRVGRVRHEDGIAGASRCQRQMSQALLGTQGHNGLGSRIQSHVITPLIPVTNRLAQARNTLGLRIAMGIAALGCLYQLVDYMRGGGLIRIAHPEIDNVFPRGTRLLFEFTNNVEHIGRKALDALKLIVHVTKLESLPTGGRRQKKGENSTESAPRCQRNGGWIGIIDELLETQSNHQVIR